MTAHIVEVGPSLIRELCCGGAAVVDNELARTALEGIDDPVVLVDECPVTIDAVWRDALETLRCDDPDCAVVVHPSWWAPSRIDVVSRAAQVLADDIVMRPRTWLLSRATRGAAVVVEIAERFVVITGAALAAESRRGEPQNIAEAVVRRIVEMAVGTTAAVVIDAPNSDRALATMIADGLRASTAIPVEVGDARLKELAAAALTEACNSPSIDPAPHGHRRYRWVGLVVPALAAALAVSALGRHAAPEGDRMPTTFLVEGRVAFEVPAQWPMRRIVAGPGSARVQVTSPSDPEVAVHVTQSRVPTPTLAATAESLKHAIDAEPTGVFVDFNPAGTSGGRPAVTYREIRASHDIRWIVLVDGDVRISIGCQSRHGHDDAVRDVCELAVRSARALH